MVFKQGIVVGTQAGWRSRAENNVTKHPADRRTIRRAATHGKSDDPTRVLVHHNHHPMRPEDQRLTAEQIDAPETVLAVAGKCQPGWTVGARIRPAVLGQHAPHQVFVHGAPVAAGSGFDVLVAGVVDRSRWAGQGAGPRTGAWRLCGRGTVKLTEIHSFSTRSQFVPTRQISDSGGMSISGTSRKSVNLTVPKKIVCICVSRDDSLAHVEGFIRKPDPGASR